ncbi:MAG: response regulator [Gammaproteobacteria bacterium]
MQPIKILLVEDDSIDAKAFMRALDQQRISNSVTIARDGVEAWEVLKGKNANEPLGLPYIIVLDINMPRMSGLELLRKIRGDEELRDSIVLVLTTSNDDEDRIKACNLGVAGYMLKSDVGNSCRRAAELVQKYWRVVEMSADHTVSVDAA